MSISTLHDTIYALSTPLGTSALATLRLSGSDAIGIAAKCIESSEKLFTALGGDSFYTNVCDANGDHIDDVVVTVWRAPRSYNGEDIIEFHTHGSPVIMDMLGNQLTLYGARLAEHGEFSRRAFMNGKQSPEELERTLMRLDASSEESLTKIERVLGEKFDRLRNIYDDIISLLAQVNAQIDFGESDHVEITGFEIQVAIIIDKLENLRAKAVNEQINKGYYSVALTGVPNVGKSSLFNTLLRYERSIVSEIPGTTRDYVEAFVMLEGFKVKIIDTAGLRDASDMVETKGIELGTNIAERADVVLRVTDPETRATKGFADEIVVHNKCDIDGFRSGMFVSAQTAEGLPELSKYIALQISLIDSANTGYSLSKSEARIIDESMQLLAQSSKSTEISIVAEDIRAAADQIASLLGFNISEDSLNYIFSKMCIGK